MALDALTTSSRSLHRKLALFAARSGYQRPSDIPEDMRFTQWVEDLGRKGLRIDRKPFSLADRPALRPVYDAIPATREEARGRFLVVQKATQLGLTVWEVLAQIYMAIKFSPVNIGMFLPDQNTAIFKSSQRFMPIIRSAPMLLERLVKRVEDDGTTKKIGEGNVLTRELAASLLMFLWTSGKVTTESRPMDIISLDEVQEMLLDQIDKVIARLGDSEIAFALLLSTANLPDLDINFWYQLGTQEVWHTQCEACGAESDLSDPAGIFPARSTAYNTGQIKGAPKDEFVYVCPVCRGWIRNAQIGRYIAKKPENASTGIRSFLLPRTISPRMTPRDMVTRFHRAKSGDQKKSFFNRTLARPYIDPSQLPVTLAALEAAARAGAELGLKWESSAKGTYMGIDQMGGWNAHIIKGRLPDGRQAVLHVEAVFGDNPFARSAELMKQYGVAYCVVETLPNFNDARRFANAFPRKVFLANYADLKSDAIVWGDDMSRSDRRTTEEDRTRWTVILNQYRTMQTALFRLRDMQCLWPDPDTLQQVVPDKEGERMIPIVRDWAWDHFTKTALVVEMDEETRKPKSKVKKVGLDPHFSYANMLCDVAWARDGGSTTFIMTEGTMPKAFEQPDAARRIVNEPGVPAEIKAMVAEKAPGTCGTCEAFQDGNCTARGLRVREADPACILYVEASS